MKVITPIQVTDAILTSTTVAEPSAQESLWSATAVYGLGDKVVLSTSSATVTISNGAPAIITWTANNLGIGTPVRFTVSGGGSLPTGLSVGPVYYVVLRIGLNAFVVSDTLNGAPIVTSSAGSGTFTCTAYPHRSYTALTGATGIGITMTIAAPAVVTWTSHGRSAGDAIVFTTTSALPTGVTAGTTYYVLSTGLTADQFQFSTSIGGTAVTTTGTQSGTHTCGLALTYNKPPMLNTNVWNDTGASNQVACFDLYRNSATSGASPMTMVLTPGARVDSNALLGVIATQAVVSMTSVAGGGTVYNRTVSLVTRTIANWYEYFYKPFLYQTALALFDLPPYSDAVITITITDPAGRVQVADVVIGLQTDIGELKYGAVSDVLSFSTITRDNYGGVVLTPRKNSGKNTFPLRIRKGSVDAVRTLRAAIDAKPAVFAGLTDSTDGYYGSFLSKAIYRRFPINADLPNWAEATLETDGI